MHFATGYIAPAAFSEYRCLNRLSICPGVEFFLP
jgi:hypothetical protein